MKERNDQRYKYTIINQRERHKELYEKERTHRTERRKRKQDD
jgi:hypothetical protein